MKQFGWTVLILVIGICLSTAHQHDHDHHDHHNHNHPNHKHEHDHHHHHKSTSSTKFVPSKHAHLKDWTIWSWAIGSTVVIGTAPVLILYFVPISDQHSSEKSPLLNILLGFSVGGLLGDVFLHLLPHAGAAHDHSHSHEHPHDLSMGLWILSGILSFLIIEKIMRYRTGAFDSSHSHSISSDEVAKKKKDDDYTPPSQSIQVGAYLNLAADFFHNFTDGLAVGSSFLHGQSLGLVTVVAILLHELPHEISDFAILVRSGVSPRRAMLLQFLTAIGALLGTIAGLLVEGAAEAAGASWILPFTAGGFIYISTVTVIPQLLSTRSILQSIGEIAAICLGIALMGLIGYFE